ncbi:MAG: Outer rane receptor for ferrienterochelin and colicin [Bryobacterales bacterium]|nr:Outer rane receptor for ferrienterochelin and colicin [Bryobacterales bacterium]
MNKLFIRLLFCLPLLAPLSNAADVSVRVVDSHHAPIAGATISLISHNGGENRNLTTDVSGTCRFQRIAAGQYLIMGEAPGFDASRPQTVDLKGEELSDVDLALGIAQVRSSVTVTASGTPQSTDEVSKALTVVDGETISLRADKSLGEALLDVPGLRVQQLGGPGSTTYFKVRGLRNTDTAVLVDGLRLRDAAGTQADASGVLQDLVITNTSQVEVLRGSGSSLYGTDATGGVVNIITDEGGGRTRGSVLFDGGSLGSVRGMAHLAGGFDHDRVQYSVGITHWNVMSGVDGDSPARNTSGQGQLTYRLSRIASLSARIYTGDSFSFVRLSPRSVGSLPATGIIDAVAVSLSEEHRYESGTPLSQLVLGGATFLPAAYNSDSTRAGRFFTGALRFTLRPSDRLGFTAQYQDLSTTRNYGDGPAGPGSQPAGSSLSKYLGEIQTANGRLDASWGKYQHFDAGYEFESENFQNRLLPPVAASDFFTSVTQRSNAFFAQDQLHFLDGRLQFAGAYRVQSFALDQPVFQPIAGAPFTGRTFSAPPTAQTGDASTSYTLRRSGTKIRAHAGRSYRAPSLFERFGVFFSGSSYTLYGDPSLRPDRSSSIDGGVDQTMWNSRVRLSGTYFYTRLNEVIIFDTSGAINAATDPLGRNGGYRNTQGGIARGAEFSASVAATRSLQLTGTYTYTDARQQTPLVAGVWRTYEIPQHQYSMTATQRFSARLTGFFVFSGSSDYLASVSGRAFQFKGPARGQAGLSYRRPMGEFRAIRIYGKADNLFNQTYFENGFRTPGRTLTGGTQFEF